MYRKNTAGQFIAFQGVDTSGAVKSGVTWTVRRCIDGTFAAATGTATEDGTTGWYKFAMSQADTNGNNIQFNFTGTGAVPQTVNIITDGSPPDINLKNANGTAITTTTAGVPVVDVGRINNVVTTSVTTVKAVIGLTTADTISALGANTITAASIAASALNGKGDWLLASSYTAPPSAATIAALIVTGSAINSNELNTLLSDYGLQTLLCGITGDVGGRILGNTGGGGGGGITTGPGVWAEDGSGNAIAPAATALTSAIWTNARAANLDNLNAAVSSLQATFTAATGVTFPTNFGTMSIDTNGRVKIQSGVIKNTAISGFGFFMCDSSDHVTGKTGLTITATRSLDGAAPGACANSATEVGGGKYKIDLAAADLNGNTVVLTFSGTGADDRIIEIVTTP